MPLDLKPGDTIPIPCRHCGKSFISFELRAGDHAIACARCGCVTEVSVRMQAAGPQVRTRPGPTSGGGNSDS